MGVVVIVEDANDEGREFQFQQQQEHK